MLSLAADPLAIELVGQWNTPADTVAVAGSYAYVGIGNQFDVLDRSLPGQPSLVSGLPLPGAIRDIEIAADLAYVAAGDAGLLVMDIADPANPQLLGSYDTPGQARGVDLANGLIYLADGDEGILVLRLVDNRMQPPVFNDNFADRIAIVGTSASVTGSNASASSEPNEPEHAYQYGGRSVWWTWTAPTAGIVTISTAGSDFDTVLAVYTGTSIDALTLVPGGANDDDGDLRTSRVSVAVEAGVSCQIAVDGFDGEMGAIALHLTLATPAQAAEAAPANDHFADALLITGTSATVAGDNTSATFEAGEPAHGGMFGFVSVWWSWTAPVAGTVIIDTAGSTFDTLLGVYTGSGVDALALVPGGSNDDYGGLLTSRVSIQVGAGTTYHIAVDGVDGFTGAITLNLNPEGVVPPPVSFELLSQRAGQADAVAASAEYVCIGAGQTLTVFNVGALDQPALGTFALAGAAGDIELAGNFAFVSLGGAGVQFVDVADPAQPAPMGVCDTTGQARGIEVVGNAVYVADGATGVALLQVDPNAALIVNRDLQQSIDASRTLVMLTIADAGRVIIAPGAGAIIETAGLWIGDDGVLDLADNRLIVRATPQTRDAVLARVADWIRTGAMMSSTVSGLTAPVAILNDRGDGTPIRTDFGGAPAGINDILIMRSYRGDANLDGLIDAADYFRIDLGFLLRPASARSQDGDVDGDGLIDGDDFFLIDLSFIGQAGPLGLVMSQAMNEERVLPVADQFVELPATAPLAAPAPNTSPVPTAVSSQAGMLDPEEESVWAKGTDEPVFML